MRALGDEMRDDPDLRALVVIGNGRAFSSGIDTSRVHRAAAPTRSRTATTRARRHADPTVDGILRTQEAYSWLAEARYPTIAAVRGYALGAGLQIALACDIRVFARGTQVGLLEHKYGILPDLGGTQRLPRVVGAGKAKELIWTAARIDAEEAYRIGLCERLVDERRSRERKSTRSRRRSPRSRRSRCRARSARSRPRAGCRSPKGSSSRPQEQASASARPTCARRSPRSSSNATPTTPASSAVHRMTQIPRRVRERAARRPASQVSGRDEELGPEADGGRAARAGRHARCATCPPCATST